jgi:hypothetical protein
MLLDRVAAFLTFVAAGGYLVLKALNDRHSALMPVIERVSKLLYSLGIHELPGLPEYRAVRQFAIPAFADCHMLTMAALHLLAAAGLLALASGLGTLRPWARRAHLELAGILLLILGAYAVVYAKSDAPSIGLAVIAAGAVVPAAVLAILLMPPIASHFRPGPGSDRRTVPGSGARDPSPPQFALGLVLVLYLLFVLAIVAIVSVPVAIDLRTALVAAQ